MSKRESHGRRGLLLLGLTSLAAAGEPPRTSIELEDAPAGHPAPREVSPGSAIQPAEDRFSRLLERSGRHELAPQEQLDLADALLQAKRPREALTCVQRAGAAGGERSVVLAAQALIADGRTTDACDLLERSLKQFPQQHSLWDSYITAALSERRHFLALRRAEQAATWLGDGPQLAWWRAQAYAGLGRLLGRTAVRHVEDGQPGQFAGDWLLLEPRGDDSFLCCPAESAMYQARRAADAGLGGARAQLLLARGWLACGRADLAWSLVSVHEEFLIALEDIAVLEALMEITVAAREPAAYLRAARRRVQLDPAKQPTMRAAYLNAAELFSERGDERMFAAMLCRALDEQEDLPLRLRLADIEWSCGRRDAARRHYEKILTLDERHPERSRIALRLWGDGE